MAPKRIVALAAFALSLPVASVACLLQGQPPSGGGSAGGAGSNVGGGDDPGTAVPPAVPVPPPVAAVASSSPTVPPPSPSGTPGGPGPGPGPGTVPPSSSATCASGTPASSWLQATIESAPRSPWVLECRAGFPPPWQRADGMPQGFNPCTGEFVVDVGAMSIDVGTTGPFVRREDVDPLNDCGPHCALAADEALVLLTRTQLVQEHAYAGTGSARTPAALTGSTIDGAANFALASGLGDTTIAVTFRGHAQKRYELVQPAGGSPVFRPEPGTYDLLVPTDAAMQPITTNLGAAAFFVRYDDNGGYTVFKRYDYAGGKTVWRIQESNDALAVVAKRSWSASNPGATPPAHLDLGNSLEYARDASDGRLLEIRDYRYIAGTGIVFKRFWRDTGAPFLVRQIETEGPKAPMSAWPASPVSSNVIHFDYAAGELAAVKHAGDSTNAIGRSAGASGNAVVTLTDPLGKTMTFTFRQDGRIDTIRDDVTTDVLTFTYWSDGRYGTPVPDSTTYASGRALAVRNSNGFEQGLEVRAFPQSAIVDRRTAGGQTAWITRSVAFPSTASAADRAAAVYVSETWKKPGDDIAWKVQVFNAAGYPTHAYDRTSGVLVTWTPRWGNARVAPSCNAAYTSGETDAEARTPWVVMRKEGGLALGRADIQETTPQILSNAKAPLTTGMAVKATDTVEYRAELHDQNLQLVRSATSEGTTITTYTRPQDFPAGLGWASTFAQTTQSTFFDATGAVKTKTKSVTVAAGNGGATAATTGVFVLTTTETPLSIGATKLVLDGRLRVVASQAPGDKPNAWALQEYEPTYGRRVRVLEPSASSELKNEYYDSGNVKKTELYVCGHKRSVIENLHENDYLLVDQSKTTTYGQDGAERAEVFTETSNPIPDGTPGLTQVTTIGTGGPPAGGGAFGSFAVKITRTFSAAGNIEKGRVREVKTGSATLPASGGASLLPTWSSTDGTVADTWSWSPRGT